jgi:hypothetical protein
MFTSLGRITRDPHGNQGENHETLPLILSAPMYAVRDHCKRCKNRPRLLPGQYQFDSPRFLTLSFRFIAEQFNWKNAAISTRHKKL